MFLIIKYVEGVDAPVLASVKIAKNAQPVAEINILTLEWGGVSRGALSSINISYDLRRFSNKLSQTLSTTYS